MYMSVITLHTKLCLHKHKFLKHQICSHAKALLNQLKATFRKNSPCISVYAHVFVPHVWVFPHLAPTFTSSHLFHASPLCHVRCHPLSLPCSLVKSECLSPPFFLFYFDSHVVYVMFSVASPVASCSVVSAVFPICFQFPWSRPVCIYCVSFPPTFVVTSALPVALLCPSRVFRVSLMLRFL